MRAGTPERIVVLSGGVGGARFLRALTAWNRARPLPAQITAVVNTADDFWHFGVRICPDLDSVLYTLAGVGDAERGWGRRADSETVLDELRAWQAPGTWFSLGDRDLALSLFRTQLLREGLGLAKITARLAERWPLGVRILPATEQPIETRVSLAPAAAGSDEPEELGFQEWWVRRRASADATGFRVAGLERAHAGPGVLEALAAADRVLIAPSNPIVSIWPILGIPVIREVLEASSARVLGLSPLLAGRPVRGHADRCLSIAGVPPSSAGIAGFYGPRRPAVAGLPPGILAGWLIDERDAAQLDEVRALGITAAAAPILFPEDPSDHRIVRALLALAADE